LYSIFYFDKKDKIKSFLKELSDSLIKDLELEDKVKVNIVDFQ
jgi:hypothetical protein